MWNGCGGMESGLAGAVCWVLDKIQLQRAAPSCPAFHAVCIAQAQVFPARGKHPVTSISMLWAFAPQESWQYLQLPPPALMKKEDYAGWRPTLTGVDVELPYKKRPADEADGAGEDSGVDGDGKSSVAGEPAGAPSGAAIA